MLPAILAGLGCDPGPRTTKDKAGAAPGAESLDELRERGLAALRAGDDAAYLELVGSPAFLMKYCSEEPRYGALEEGGAVAARDLQKEAVRDAIATCIDVDWSRATLDHVEGGEPRTESRVSCSPASEEFEDLVSVFRVGDATWRVKVANDVYRVAGRYLVLDSPVCERQGR